MELETRPCKRCGETDWKEIDELNKSYPERRKDRAQTEKHVLVCRNCEGEARVFDDGQSGAVTYSGAMRA